MKKTAEPPGRGRTVLSCAGRARSAGGDGGLRALSLVRALVGRVEVRAVAGGCGQNPGQRGAAAEDGPAGCGTSADADAGGSFSADLGAEPGGAGRAAVAGASSQASAGADPDQETTAGAGHEPGRAEEGRGRRGGRAAGGGEVDGACRSGSVDRVGDGADGGTGGALPGWAQ